MSDNTQPELMEIDETDSEARKIVIKLINYVIRGEPSGDTRVNPKQAEEAILELIDKRLEAVMDRLEIAYMGVDGNHITDDAVEEERSRLRGNNE